jgi:hypothetical protein
MKFNKIAPFLLLLLLVIASLLIRQGCNKPSDSNAIKKTKINYRKTETRGLNRNPAHINYSKHALCRMDCRHISKSEVKDILQNGKINYRKSELQVADCRKKYAVEAYSADRQHLRIIFAPCGDELTVVTCIDLGQEWTCNCP